METARHKNGRDLHIWMRNWKYQKAMYPYFCQKRLPLDFRGSWPIFWPIGQDPPIFCKMLFLMWKIVFYNSNVICHLKTVHPMAIGDLFFVCAQNMVSTWPQNSNSAHTPRAKRPILSDNLANSASETAIKRATSSKKSKWEGPGLF